VARKRKSGAGSSRLRSFMFCYLENRDADGIYHPQGSRDVGLVNGARKPTGSERWHAKVSSGIRVEYDFWVALNCCGQFYPSVSPQ